MKLRRNSTRRYHKQCSQISRGLIENIAGRGDGPDELIAWYQGPGTTARRFAHQDERGSVIAVTDSAGTVLALNKYDEYGAPQAGNLGRFQYTGQLWLPEVGLYHYKNRVYGPHVGRFWQSDPIGYEGGPNLYAYVGNDPVNSVDPFGLDGEELGTTPEPTPRSDGPIIVEGFPSSYEDWVRSTITSGYQHFISNLNYLLGPAAWRISNMCANNPTLCGAVVVKGKRKVAPRIPIHFYSTLNLVIPCSASNAQIANVARRFAGPGQPARPIGNGEQFQASVLGQQGPVITTFATYGNFSTSVITTRNTTLLGHPLYNGSVSRDWFRGPNGGVWVSTVGRGQNTSGSMGSINTLAGPLIFNSLDRSARAYSEANICR